MTEEECPPNPFPSSEEVGSGRPMAADFPTPQNVPPDGNLEPLLIGSQFAGVWSAISSDEDGENEEPVSFTGRTVVMNLDHKAKDGTTTRVTLSTTNGGLTVSEDGLEVSFAKDGDWTTENLNKEGTWQITVLADQFQVVFALMKVWKPSAGGV
jgi:hypothetical protein